MRGPKCNKSEGEAKKAEVAVLSKERQESMPTISVVEIFTRHQKNQTQPLPAAFIRGHPNPLKAHLLPTQ
jgi:hypothetical protein